MAWKIVERTAADERPLVFGAGPYRETLVSNGSVLLTRSWRNRLPGGLWPPSFIAVVFNGVMIAHVFETERRFPTLSLLEALRQRGLGDRAALIGMCIGSLVLAYIALALWINQTRIIVTPTLLTIERGPLPWPEARIEMGVSRVQALHIQERYWYSHGDDEHFHAYRLVAKVDGKDLEIDRGIPSEADARVLKRWVEMALWKR